MKFACALLSTLVVPTVSEIPVADVSRVDWDAVKADIKSVMNTPSWDDGSYAPFFIRLAWHSSGTFNKEDGSGGSNGATMRFPPESEDPQNGGLDQARATLEPIYEKHAKSGLTHSDLWVLAAYVGLEMTAGPKVEFTGGRVDAAADKAVENGRLPNPEFGLDDGLNVDDQNRLSGWQKTAGHIRSVFNRMGFNDQEAVALISGGHSYGRCHRDFTGYEGAWQDNAIYFANEYITDMIDDDWRAIDGNSLVPEGFPPNSGYAPDDVRPKGATRQYIDITTINPNIPGMLGGMRADDAAGTEITLGEYIIDTIWMNIRETAETNSSYLARAPSGTTFTIVELQNVTNAEGSLSVRGLSLEGGWVTLNKGDPLYFRKLRDLDSRALAGKYRMRVGKQAGKEFECRRVRRKEDGEMVCELNYLSRGFSETKWVTLYSPEKGVLADRIKADYNEQGPRVPLKDLYGHQMMLVGDMVLKWDSGFRKYMDIYYADEDLLRDDFGKAFKKLTENGCAWSSELSVVV